MGWLKNRLFVANTASVRCFEDLHSLRLATFHTAAIVRPQVARLRKHATIQTPHGVAAFPMITLLQICRWLYRTLNSEARPWQIGVAVVLGALAGLLPYGLAMFAVFVVILLVNCNFGTAFFSWGMFRLISWSLQLVLIRPMGAVALEMMPQTGREFLIACATTPVVSWLRLEYTDVAGAIAFWCLIAVPLAVFSILFFRRYQETLRARLGNSRIMKVLSQIWLFKALRYVFAG